MAEKFLGTYDPAQVQLMVGPLQVTGFADGTFITVARTDKDIYKMQAGAGGEIARIKNNNSSGTITFTLKSTSPARRTLDLMKNNPTVIPVMVKNNSDLGYIAAAAQAWIATDPDVAFAAEESNIEYVVACADLNGAAL